MKRMFLILGSLFLFNVNGFAIASPQNKFVRNEKCEDIDSVEVFQVLKDFSLANACGPFYCNGYTVFVPKEDGKIYYDGQRIKPKKGECIYFSGTYKYKSKNGNLNTVPILSFISEKP